VTKLEQVRRAAGLSQRELGRRSGVNHAGICRAERGRVNFPRVRTLQRIAEALGVSDWRTLAGFVTDDPTGRAA